MTNEFQWFPGETVPHIADLRLMDFNLRCIYYV